MQSLNAVLHRQAHFWLLASIPFALSKHGPALLQGAALGGVWGKLLHDCLHSINASHIYLQDKIATAQNQSGQHKSCQVTMPGKGVNNGGVIAMSYFSLLNFKLIDALQQKFAGTSWHW